MHSPLRPTAQSAGALLLAFLLPISAAAHHKPGHKGTPFPDAGTPDAGRPDAGAPDAGRPDAGAPDAGTPPPPSGWLFTSGNRILNSDGTIWKARGANIFDTRSCNACAYQPPNVAEVNRRVNELV